jgi:hypothetical protein
MDNEIKTRGFKLGASNSRLPKLEKSFMSNRTFRGKGALGKMLKT